MKTDLLNEITVGTIFYNSWGYEQTNIDWYQVVEITKSRKSIKLHRIESLMKTPSPYEMRGKTFPRVDHFKRDEKPFLKRVQECRGELYLAMEHGSLTVWDGKPKDFSSYA